MGFDRCQQTCVQNTAQDYFYRESQDVLVTKRYDIRVPVRQSYIYLIGAFLLWGHF
jgi:hypothetical protein